MANRFRLKPHWLAVATLAASVALRGQFALAQGSGTSTITAGLIPLLGSQPASNALPSTPIQQHSNGLQRAPFGRLIENPDQTEGAPPFALADQTGTIQRYVEPVPGIDLASHIGQVVTVRHDTGSTLLASQVE